MDIYPISNGFTAYDRNGKEFTVNGEGLLARCLCHEIDHLDGILFNTKIIRVVPASEVED